MYGKWASIFLLCNAELWLCFIAHCRAETKDYFDNRLVANLIFLIG